MITRSIIKSNLEEKEGVLSSQSEEEKLMHSIIEGEKTEEGKLINDAVNIGMFSFNPDIMFSNIVKNYADAKKLYGEGFLRKLVSEKDINLPEVQRKLKNKIDTILEELKEDGFLNKQLEITEKGFFLASLQLYIDELDKLVAKGLVGEKTSKKISHYGEKQDTKKFKHDRYRDLAIRKSIKLAIRRSHKNIKQDDLMAFERESKGKIYLIYALDASGSMKGSKIGLCKKAGIALAFKAVNELDKVGLLVFGSKVENVVYPTNDFWLLLNNVAKIRANKETNIKDTILKSIEMFPDEDVTKHLILVTDAMPTYGKNPEQETLDAVSDAVHCGITISVIGIALDKKGVELGKRISSIGQGKFQIVKNLENLDRVILEDYYALS